MSGGHGFEIDWDDPYVIQVSGFWLGLARGGRGQAPNPQAIEKRRQVRRRKFFEKVAECLKTKPNSAPEASSSCMTPTPAR